MSLILTVGAAAVGSVTLQNERPQFLLVELTGGVAVDSLNVTGNVSGNIISLDGVGIQTLGICQQKTQFTTSFLFPLGLGRKIETTTITVDTGVATTANIYAFSLKNDGSPSWVYEMVTQNPNSTTSYSKFYYMGFNPGAGQTYIVQGNDGIVSPMTSIELRQLAGQDVNLPATFVFLNNIDQKFGQITISTGAAPLTVYKAYQGTK